MPRCGPALHYSYIVPLSLYGVGLGKIEKKPDGGEEGEQEKHDGNIVNSVWQALRHSYVYGPL